MNVLTTVQGPVTIVTLTDNRLDAARTVRFKEAIREISDGGASHIVLDMSAVTFMDSSGLGAVVAVMKLMGPDKPLELVGLTPTVQKVFRLTKMDTIFRIYPSLSDVPALIAAKVG